MPRLLWAAPQLFTGDVGRLAAWFASDLGFQLVFLAGDPPFYGQVERDGVRLNLRHVASPPIDPGLRLREELLSAYLVVDDVEALHAEFSRHGVAGELAVALAQPSYFLVTTPDGELISFAEG